MTQPNILELAKQGDAKAIALLLNRQLQAKGITAAASLKDGCLQVMLEAAEAPSQQILAPWVSKSIAGLGAASIEKVKVYGRQTGAKVPAWSQEFEVAGPNLPVANVTEGRASPSENTESNQLSLKERAKLGDLEAIASLLNLPLQNKGITATASLQDGCLQVMLESDVVPDEEASIRIVRRELTNLKAGAIASVKVYGQQAGEDFPAWNREFEIVVQVSHPTSKADTSTPKPSKKVETEELVEMLVPGLKQLKNGITGIGVAWLLGAFIGYLWMFWVGLIIHAIYIWKYFDKQVIKIVSILADQFNNLVSSNTTFNTQPKAENGNTSTKFTVSGTQSHQNKQSCPRTYLGASILVTILAFPPLGIAAIIFAAQVVSKYEQGDYEGAKSNSNTAKVLCIVGGAIAVTFYVLLLSVFGISLFANTQLESQAKQSEAKQYISSINRGQQAYYAEHTKFSSTIEEIGLGLKTETNNYKYTIFSVDNTKVIASATAKNKNLKSYTGAVFSIKGIDGNDTTKADVCETDRPSQTPPNIPQLIGNDIQCPAGSVSLDSLKSVSPDSLKSDSTKVGVEVPTHPSCSRKYVSVKLDTFENCLVDGMTYSQVANVLGYAGKLQSQSGSIEMWQWNDGEGKYLSAIFSDGKLMSKSQIGLEPGRD
ncbi:MULTISPECIES: type IV pilin-like G/H family protein [unclassified Microcoleus]|uniref:type IV pilin-like G/H family protein n=2 Tax=Microcoleus TaxID=44471 RepID=UPI002FD66C88